MTHEEQDLRGRHRRILDERRQARRCGDAQAEEQALMALIHLERVAAETGEFLPPSS